jgi:pentatricopeptide repeat protein
MPVKESAGAQAGGRRSPWPEPSREQEGVSADDALQTNTLAELYLRQGLVDRAMEVYRGMLRVDPGNLKAARRLSELAQGGQTPPGARTAAPAPSPRSGAGGAPPPAAPRSPAPIPVIQAKADDGPRRDTIRRLERWLANVGTQAQKGGPPR